MFTVRRRGLVARVGMAVAVIGGIAAVALPGANAGTSLAASPSSPASASSSTASASHTKCVTIGVGTTCTGTYSGDNAYDPWTGTQIKHAPVVTVSQTKNLTDQVVNVKWQYFTPTLGYFPNVPNSGIPQQYEVNIYECKGTNPTWVSPADDTSGLSGSCYEYAPGLIPGPTGLANAFLETALGTGQGGGVTYDNSPNVQAPPGPWGGPSSTPQNPNTGGSPADWTGQVQFHIEAGVQKNSFLGCDVTTPCSLVIAPNFGGQGAGSLDLGPDGTGQCENHTNDDPIDGGQLTNNAYISYACEIRDRIVVPLHFAPTETNCPPKATEFYAEGSPMMARQMTQWQSAFCNGTAPVSLTFTQVSESSARSAFLRPPQAFAASIDMALTTLPATASQVSSSSRKFTYAPLANSGTAIAYYLDDAQPSGSLLAGQQINRVVLDPRLVAKLTTESYSLGYGCTVEPPSPWPRLKTGKPSISCDPAVSHNTPNLFDDREFRSLNKHCQPAGAAANYVCGASDFPNDAGLSNTVGLGPFLPTVLGAQSDMTYQLTSWVGANAAARAFLAGQPDPQGMHVNTYYKNTAYPVQSFQALDTLGVTYPLPVTCNIHGCNWPYGFPTATMNVAWNFVVRLGDIATRLLEFQPNADSPHKVCQLSNNACTNLTQYGYYNLIPQVPGSRALFSEMDLGDVGAYQFPAAALVNAAGAAVAPTQASVEAAVKNMTTNPDGITQHVNLSSKDPAAYPLAMVDYAMVPTCGLPHAEASAIADFLDKVATSGQTQGVSLGQLGPGYYPLTSAQRAQTLKAAQEVKAQHCPSAPKHPTTPPATTPPATTPTGGTTPTPTAGTTPTPTAGTTPTAPAGTTPTGGTTPPGRNPGAYNNAAYGQKSADSGISGVLLPAILLMLLGALLVGSAVWALTATGRWPTGLRWLRGARARSRTALGRLSGRPVRRA